MPELPEVETIRRQLEPAVVGARIREIEVLDPRWCEPLAPAELRDAVLGRRVEALRRRGKYLDWALEDEIHLVMHLRMTGTLLLDPRGVPAHTRVVISLSGRRRLLFVDPRRFGTGQLVLGDEALDDFYAARLGIEPFDEGFTPERLRSLARGRSAPIKAFLLDQRMIAGIGNIYADEICFAAKLSPLRRTETLKKSDVARLAGAVGTVLRAAIDASGSTLRDARYRDLMGGLGNYQESHTTYDRAGLPCVVCGRLIVRSKVAGRSTYFCPRCQR